MGLRMDCLLVAGLLCAVLGTAPVAGELQCMKREREREWITLNLLVTLCRTSHRLAPDVGQ